MMGRRGGLVVGVLVCVVLLVQNLVGAQGQKLYEYLGVSKDASQQEIKRAYRKLSKELHPDTTDSKDPGVKDRYLLVQKAYEVLKDEEKRQKYDREGDKTAEDQRRESDAAFWRAVHLFASQDDIVSIDNTKDFYNYYDAEEPWLVYFWVRNVPDSVTAGEAYKTFSGKYRSVLRLAELCCDVNQACMNLGSVNAPTVGLARRGSIRWIKGEVGAYTLVDYLYAVVEKAVLGKLIELQHIDEASLPLTRPIDFMVFQHFSCTECMSELTVALARLYILSNPQTIKLQPLVSVGFVDCTEHESVCKRFQRNSIPPGTASRPWRVAAITPAEPPDEESESTRMFVRRPPHLGINGEILGTESRYENFHAAWMEGELNHKEMLDFLLSGQMEHQKLVTPLGTTAAATFYDTVMKSADAWVVALLGSCGDCWDYLNDLELTARLLETTAASRPHRIRVSYVKCADAPQFCGGLNMEDLAQRPAVKIYPFTAQGKIADPYVYSGPWTPRDLADAAEKESPPVGMTTLTLATHPKTLTEGNDNWLILYSAGEWCPPCTAVKPVFRDAARLLASDPRLKVGYVNCDVERQFGWNHGIESYPTIVAYINSDPNRKMKHVFNGHRTPEDIYQFAIHSLTSRVITYGMDLISKTQSTQQLFVMFGAGQWCPPCTRAKQLWPEVSSQFDDVEVGMVDCDTMRNLCNNFGIQGYPTFIFYTLDRPGGQRTILPYNGPHTVEHLVHFVKTNKK